MKFNAQDLSSLLELAGVPKDQVAAARNAAEQLQGNKAGQEQLIRGAIDTLRAQGTVDGKTLAAIDVVLRFLDQKAKRT